MARRGGGSWSGGRAPAQGGTPHRMSKPEGKAGKAKGAFTRGKKNAMKKGTSPLDGRKRGKK